MTPWTVSTPGFPVLHCSLEFAQTHVYRGFPDNSVGKESAFNAGDPGLIPESGRSAGEGIGHPFQYSWASLVAQLVKNLPAEWETWIQSLGCKDPLEKGKITHASILAWRIPWTVTKSQTRLSNFHFTCPLSQWCHPTISSSVTPFSSCIIAE